MSKEPGSSRIRESVATMKHAAVVHARLAVALAVCRVRVTGLFVGTLALAACALSALGAGPGPVAAVDGRTVITVKVFGDCLPNPNRTDTAGRADLAVARRFRERFPEIFAERYREKYRAHPEIYGRHDWEHVEIRLEPFSGIKVEGVETDLLSIAGGMPPDILYLNFRKSDNYIANGFLHPLDDYLATMTQAELDFRIHGKLWPVIRRKGPGGELRTWAMPYGGALGKVLLYRKDLFAERGIRFPDNAWTWEDMLAAARRITDPKRGRYGIMLGKGKHESWHWITFLWSAGGEAMAYDEATDAWRCVFASRQAAVALDYYTRLSAERWTDADGNIRRGYAYKGDGDEWVKWERGEIGMQLSYIDEKLFANINPDQVGMVPVPLGPPLPPELAARLAGQGLLWDGRTRGGELNSRMMGLSSQIAEPAVRDAAWEYMRFYDSEEANAIRTRVMVEGGLGRFVNPRYLRQFGYPEIERLSPPGWAETFEVAIQSGQPEPYGRNSNLAYAEMTPPIHRAERLALGDLLPEDPERRLDVLEELLREANARANEIMIGIVTPRQRFWRRLVASLTLLAIVAAFLLVFRRIMRDFTPTDDGRSEHRGWGFRRHAWAYVLLLPAGLSILAWQYVPILRGSAMAFLDYRLIGASAFVGVDNFGDVLFNPNFWNAIYNSLRYSFLVLSLTFLPPIFLAILLQEIPAGRLLFRILYYLPAVVTGLVTMLLWKQFFDPSERGAMNALALAIPAIGYIAIGLVLLGICLAFARRVHFYQMRTSTWGFVILGAVLFLTCAGIPGSLLFPAGRSLGASLAALPTSLFARLPEPYRWLSDPGTAMLACVIPMVWAGIGPGCLIYLAALKGIADDYYEAADIDGATFVDKILFIVFPSLKVLIMINFVGAFINAWFWEAGNILAMTGGGGNTETAGLLIWYQAFTYLELGPATAMAWMIGFLMVGFTVQQLRILSRVEFKAAGQTK